jgi:hypothetical protein
MTKSREAKLRERFTTSGVRPVRERVVQRQLVSVRHGTTVNELIEEQTKGGGILQQRTAVRFVSGDVPGAPISTGPRFAHDFSRVPTQTRPVPVIQAQSIAGEKNDQYGQEISLAPGGSWIQPPIADRLGANPTAPLIQRQPSAPPCSTMGAPAKSPSRWTCLNSF